MASQELRGLGAQTAGEILRDVMSRQSVEIVRGNFDARNRGEDDLKAFVGEHLAPDVTLHAFADFADSQTSHGRDEVLRLWLELRGAWESLEIASVELVAVGTPWLRARSRGVMKGTEDEVEMRLASTSVVREAKLTEIRYFRSFAEPLEAARRGSRQGVNGSS